MYRTDFRYKNNTIIIMVRCSQLLKSFENNTFVVFSSVYIEKTSYSEGTFAKPMTGLLQLARSTSVIGYLVIDKQMIAKFNRPGRGLDMFDSSRKRILQLLPLPFPRTRWR